MADVHIDTSALRERSSEFRFGDEHGSGSDSGYDAFDVADDSQSSSCATDAKTGTSASVIGGKRSIQLSKRLRQTVIILFVYVAVFAPLVMFISTRDAEVDSFESAFEGLGSQVVESFGTRLASMLNGIDMLSIAITSFAINTDNDFPFITIPDFHLRGQRAMDLSFTAYMSFLPLVTEENRAAWEEYSMDNLWWYYDTIAYLQEQSARVLRPPEETPEGFRKEIYNFVPNGTAVVHPGPGPYFPSWQIVPAFPSVINSASPLVGVDIGVVETMMNTSTAVIGEELVYEEGPRKERLWWYYTNLLRVMRKDYNYTYVGEPLSNVYYPAFDTFDSSRQVSGMYVGLIPWLSYLENMLPPGSKGIVCVISNECGDEFSFMVRGEQAEYLGSGDFHDEDYDYLVKEFNFVEVHDLDVKVSNTAAHLNSDFCPFKLLVYPSDELQQEHITNQPTIYAMIVLLVFFVVYLISMMYDVAVQARMRTVLKTADENRAVVASMFPEAFRDRLFADGEEDAAPVFSMGAPNKMRLKAMLGQEKKETEGGKQDLSFLSAKPIADLFPHCTVLFADISGFSAWSSERQPEQVFILLETIFQAFDKIARRRGVFKVETVRDSYVAVTGLPDPQPDHAIRMSRFAKDCLAKACATTKSLEATLGPDTGELKMRFGLHSGQVTAGVLRGEKSRFQLFGDTINTASRMESTGIKNRVQLSHSTAQLLIEAGKENWIIPREDTVKAKGKGVVQTYWMVAGGRRDQGSVVSSASFISEATMESSTDVSFEDLSEVFNGQQRHDLWGDNAGVFAMPSSAQTAKSQRLVSWLTDIIAHDLKQLVALRAIQKRRSRIHGNPDPNAAIDRKSMPLDEVVEAFAMPKFNPNAILKPEDIEAVKLPDLVMEQLTDFVSRIKDWYRHNPFHNFEHASHVTMSSVKLLKRIMTPDGVDYTHTNNEAIAEDLHQHTFGITTDPLCHFAVTLACVIHDVDHSGVGNPQLAKENPSLGEKYQQQSIAEQNSVDIAWDMLMESKYKALQHYIFTNERELQRFRQYLVNMVCATDIFNKEQKAMRNERWSKAFSLMNMEVPASAESTAESTNASTSYEDEAFNRKATIVLEHIIQAADVSHTMQHWKVYKKWNERLFQEMFSAYDNGRGGNDPSEGWYKGELWFFDNYIIPLAQKLEECGVFGVSSDECLNYALENRKEWALKGKGVVRDMTDRYQKRKMLEVEGFTSEEIENFTPQDLDHILRRLIKKGRTFATFHGHNQAGLTNAAKAWFDALELCERSDSMLADRSIEFPIYSGFFVFLKGGLILQDEENAFENLMVDQFVRDAKKIGGAIHYARALSLKCEVLARKGNYEEALEVFTTLEGTYAIEEHSQSFTKAYGTDRAAQMYSQRAYWLYKLGREEEALRQCDDVIIKVLPWMETQNILNTFELLYPVIRMMKTRGKEKYISDIFEDNVMENFKEMTKKVTLCAPVLIPLSMLLQVCGNPKDDTLVNIAVEWLLSEKNGEFEGFFDCFYARLGWAPNSITAELCLRTGKRLKQHSSRHRDNVKVLVTKGLRLARNVDNLVKGQTGFEMAAEINEPVLQDLTSMAEKLDILEGVGFPEQKEPSTGNALKTAFGEVRLVQA